MHSILLVEDNESDITIISFLIKQLGYNLDIVRNGYDAEHKILSKSYDLILLDWQLPSITGIDLLRRIKKDKLKKMIPVFMLSGRNQTKDVSTAVKEGVQDYVIKPIDALIFKNKLQTFFEQNKLNKWALTKLPQSNVSNSGAVNINTQLKELSEVEIVFTSENKLGNNEIYTLNFDLLKELQLENLAVRVTAENQELNQFVYNAVFINLNEEQLKKIRIICRSFATNKEAV